MWPTHGKRQTAARLSSHAPRAPLDLVAPRPLDRKACEHRMSPEKSDIPLQSVDGSPRLPLPKAARARFHARSSVLT